MVKKKNWVYIKIIANQSQSTVEDNYGKSCDILHDIRITLWVSYYAGERI